MELEEYKNLKEGDFIRHKDFEFMPNTLLREGSVSIKPINGNYGDINGMFTILGEVSKSCKGCNEDSEQRTMEISLAQALLFWNKR